MSYMAEKIAHARDLCPRCKSGQLEDWYEPEFSDGYAWEFFRCMNCGATIAQRYAYEYTCAEWEENDEEETC